MNTKQGILLDEQMLNYDFGEDHVMSTNRILASYYLLKELYIDSKQSDLSIITPRPLDRTYLEKAHDIEYIQMIEKLSNAGKGEALHYGLGTGDCPVWPGMADVSEFVVGSTVTAAEEVYQNSLNYAFVLLGGLHHARSNTASGFCYYNDINVAIHRLKALQDDVKILYIDTDLHHGDGVQFDFYNDPNVVTVSFHESGQFLFPGTGFPNEIGTGNGLGSSINLPFYPYTWDELYTNALDDIIPVIFESYKPDYVIWQAGSDAHIRDPLGHLMLTSSTYHHIGKMIRSLSIDVMDTPKVLALGGGGYNPYGNAKSWSNALAGLANIKLPEKGSLNWIETCKQFDVTVEADLHENKSNPISDDREVIVNGYEEYRQQLSDAISKYYNI